MINTIKQATQALHRIQEQEARDRVQYRKLRTRRLIVEGAILEKVLPIIATMSPTEMEAFLREKLHVPESNV